MASVAINSQKWQPAARVSAAQAVSFAGARIRCRDRHASSRQWLFLVQHHRVPTRLLDWSESLNAALFFACLDWIKNRNIERCSDGAVSLPSACSRITYRIRG
ncbi:MAG: FRG domain-containing protein [Nitrospira sp.]|nr:FRG domain-containing protein [Nitrospira sp.]